MYTQDCHSSRPDGLRVSSRGASLRLQGLNMIMVLMVGCSNPLPQTPSPTTTDTGVPLRAAPEDAPAPALARNTGAAGNLEHGLDRSASVLAVTPDGRLAFLSPMSGSLEATIWDFSAGAVVARSWVGLKPVREVVADDKRWILLRTTGELESISLLSGIRQELPAAPCQPHHLAISSSGSLVVYGDSCAARLTGGAWETFPILEGRRVLAAVINAEGQAAFAGEGQSEKLWIHRDRPGDVPSVIAPTASKGKNLSESPSVASPNRYEVEVSWGTMQPQSVQLQWREEGTLYAVGDGATLYRWAPGADSVPQEVPLEVSIFSPQVLAEQQQVVGLTQTGQLVRLSLVDGRLVERADLGIPQAAVSSLRLRLAGGARSLVVDSKGEGLGPARISPFLVDLQRWERKTLPPQPQSLTPCAATWLSPTSFAILATQENRGRLETLLAVVSPDVNAKNQGLEWLSVSTEALLPASNAPASHCVLTTAPDGKTLALFTGDSLKIYDLEARQRIGRRKVDDVMGLAFAADAESLYIVRREGQVERAEVPGLEEPVVLTRYPEGLEAMDATAGSDLLTLVSKGDTGHRLEVFSAERLRVLGGVNLPNRPTSVSTDISHMLSVLTFAGSRPQLWSVPSSRVGASALPESDTARFSPDGRWLLTSRESLSVRNAQGVIRSGYKGVSSIVLPGLSEWIGVSPGGGRCILVRDRSGRISLFESIVSPRAAYASLKKRFELWLLPEKQHLVLTPSAGWTGSLAAQSLLVESTQMAENGEVFAPPPPSPHLLQDLVLTCGP